MSHWTRTFVRRNSTIREVLATIDAAEMQIALVVDDQTRLLGVITDGDVRRGLLRGLDLDARAEDVMTRDPKTATPTMKRSEIERLMSTFSLLQVPVVDAHGAVVSLALRGNLLPRERYEHEVFVMAGGLGSRLGHITKHVPKPLLRVGDKPILEHILDDLLAQGFYRFRLAVNYKAELIERHFGNGRRWGAEIRYLRESKRLGTCGALGLIAEPPDRPFLVLNGDVLAKLAFKEMLDVHDAHGGAATMAVREHSIQVPYGVAELEGHRVTALVEKPATRFSVNSGIYVLAPECLALIPRDTLYDMTTLLNELLRRDLGVFAYPIDGYWLDVGRATDLKQADDDFDAAWLQDADGA